MNKNEQLELIINLDKEALDIMISKGGDYANEDVLSNFKRVSSLAKVLNLDIGTPSGYALFMTILKIDRINNLINSNKVPNNESIEDSFKDGINYFKLAYLCYLEENI